MRHPLLLGVNIDHVATLRQARGVDYPDPVEAVRLAEKGGADGITLHLREDHRHIQPYDLPRVKSAITTKMNLEMAATEPMLVIASQIRPEDCCIVPEKRQELTTEGGLDVIGQQAWIKAVCERLSSMDIQVSLFIDPDPKQIEASAACGARVIELHTGAYAENPSDLALIKIREAASIAHGLGLVVNAGHGLHYENVKPVVGIPHLNELNIGHSIVSRAVMVGFEAAVAEMKALLEKSS